MNRYAREGYQGCIGRTLDRISVFPDGRAFVCSYLFDTQLNFAQMTDGKIALNRDANEFDLFTGALAASACGGCKSAACLGGCPAEEVVMGASSCAAYPWQHGRETSRQAAYDRIAPCTAPTSARSCPASAHRVSLKALAGSLSWPTT